MALRIDIVSDVVCPWCFIGAKRVEAALERLGERDAEIVFHPFLLDPRTPREGGDLRERLREKYGVDPERMFGRVEAEARSAGIPLDFTKVRRFASTLAAHTLLRHAADKGPATQRALAYALFEAYFLKGEDIGADDVLVAVATPHGFTREEAERLVRDEAELEETRQAAAEAAASGITGVPFFILDGRLAVSGAQPVELFMKAIEQARSAKVPRQAG